MEIALEPYNGGVLLPVKGAPGSKKNELRDVSDGALKVCCTQIPEKGKANRALIEVLAKSLGLKRSQISIVSGETDTHKKFFIANITVEALSEKIVSALK